MRSVSALVGGLSIVLVGCRGILNIEDPPLEGPTSIASGLDASDAPDSGASDDAGAKVIDPGWAYWRMPPDTNLTAFKVSAGLVHDEITGLDWQRSASMPRVWASAEANCKALTLDGRTGWRLPTRIELLSILDFSAEDDPFPRPFFDSQANCYWTLSSDTSEQSHWLLVTSYDLMVIGARDDTQCASRCVIGPSYDYHTNIPPAYASGNGTVRDPNTRLEWQTDIADESSTFDKAERACNDLVLDGHDDWRLPTVKELSTLVDERRLDPAIDPRVAGESQVYWSSTPHAPSGLGTPPPGRLAWRVSFVDGSLVLADDEQSSFPNATAKLRCVRQY